MRNSTAVEMMRALAEHQRLWFEVEFPDDPAMIKCGVEDAKDYNAIADLIEQDKIVEAWEKASGLDTAARDEIPQRLYDWLYEEWEDSRDR
jgi:hypothetical protein